MEEYVQRMREEHMELRTKVNKLDTFIRLAQADQLTELQEYLLVEQLKHMQSYLKILSLRLEGELDDSSL